MKISITSFTARGTRLCCQLAGRLNSGADECTAFVPGRFLDTYCGAGDVEGRIRCRDMSLSQWTGTMFREQSAIVFVGAAGIAVRAIAPFIKDKMTDPPVVVVDEGGCFSIPILSGHVGGANALAERISGCIGAVPVITTATDVNGLFAVDVFAAANGLALTDREAARQVSARLLDGGKVGFFHEFGDWSAGVPRGCCTDPGEYNIWITVRDSALALERSLVAAGPCHVLRLVPKAVVAGVGCRRGVEPLVLEQQVLEGFRKHGIDPASVKALASIDRKKEEPALLALAGKRGWALRFYSAAELGQICGTFTESSFVEQTVGIGNVCERACMAGGGRLLFGKEAGGGVTVAAAVEPFKLNIEKYI